jgi:hypothetical protein
MSKSLYPVVKERQTGAGKSNKTGRKISREINGNFAFSFKGDISLNLSRASFLPRM